MKTIFIILITTALSTGFVSAQSWDTVTSVAGTMVSVYTWLRLGLVGTVTYAETAYVESTSLYYYGTYRDITFWNKRLSRYEPMTGTTTYETWEMQHGYPVLVSENPFPLSPSRQSRQCDLSVTDTYGVHSYVYNTLERFKFAVRNTVASQSGLWPHTGPFAARVNMGVAPLLKNCSESESMYPVTDYLDVSIPKNQIVGNIEGNLMNRQYISFYFTHP